MNNYQQFSLDTKTTACSCVVRPPNGFADKDDAIGFIKAVFLMFEGECEGIWAIVHHMDIDEEKQRVPVHVHFVFKTPPQVRHQLKWYLNRLWYILEKGNYQVELESIQVSKVISLSLAIRYLMHLDESDKVQYDLDDLLLGGEFPEKFMEEAIAFSSVLSPTDLINLVEDAKGSKKAILVAIGCQQYNRYRNIISDLCREYEPFAHKKTL